MQEIDLGARGFSRRRFRWEALSSQSKPVGGGGAPPKASNYCPFSNF